MDNFGPGKRYRPPDGRQYRPPIPSRRLTARDIAHARSADNDDDIRSLYEPIIDLEPDRRVKVKHAAQDAWTSVSRVMREVPRHASNLAYWAKSHKKITLAVTGVVAFIIINGVFLDLNKKIGRKSSDKGRAAGNTSGGNGSSTAVAPKFETVAPNSEKNQAVRMDPELKTAIFDDTIAGVPVTVSQQPLPPNFKQNPQGEVEKLAKQIYANEEIKGDGRTAYVGTSIQGPQTVVLTMNDLLVFIKSERKIDNQAWTAYINSLK